MRQSITIAILGAGFVVLSVLSYLQQRDSRQLFALIDKQQATIEANVRQLEADARQLTADAIALRRCAGRR